MFKNKKVEESKLEERRIASEQEQNEKDKKQKKKRKIRIVILVVLLLLILVSMQQCGILPKGIFWGKPETTQGTLLPALPPSDKNPTNVPELKIDGQAQKTKEDDEYYKKAKERVNKAVKYGEVTVSFNSSPIMLNGRSEANLILNNLKYNKHIIQNEVVEKLSVEINTLKLHRDYATKDEFEVKSRLKLYEDIKVEMLKIKEFEPVDLETACIYLSSIDKSKLRTDTKDIKEILTDTLKTSIHNETPNSDKTIELSGKQESAIADATTKIQSLILWEEYNTKQELIKLEADMRKLIIKSARLPKDSIIYFKVYQYKKQEKCFIDIEHQIYLSDLIPIGKTIEKAKLDYKELKRGIHKCLVYYNVFDNKTKVFIGRCAGNMTLTVAQN